MGGPSTGTTRRVVVAQLVFSVCGTLSVALAPGPAHAELFPSLISGAVKLRLDAFVAAVLSGDRLFVAGELDRVLVLDLAGAEIARMSVVDPGGLEVVGDTLFVVSVSRAKIQRFDLTTTPPTRLEPLDHSGAGRPDDIAHGNGRPWLTSEQVCDGAFPLWSLALDESDLRGHDVGGFLTCRGLHTDPHAPGRLALVDRMGHLTVVDVTGEAPVATDMGLDFVCDRVTFGPTGETVLLDEGYPTEYSIEPPVQVRQFWRDSGSGCSFVRATAGGGGVVVATVLRISGHASTSGRTRSRPRRTRTSPSPSTSTGRCGAGTLRIPHPRTAAGLQRRRSVALRLHGRQLRSTGGLGPHPQAAGASPLPQAAGLRLPGLEVHRLRRGVPAHRPLDRRPAGRGRALLRAPARPR